MKTRYHIAVAVSFLFFLWGGIGVFFAMLIKVMGWKMLLVSMVLASAFFGGLVRLAIAKEKRWAPKDPHDMARKLKTHWNFTLEEAWQVVSLMEYILRSEHDEATAYTLVRILVMRTSKDEAFQLLHVIAGKEPSETSHLAPIVDDEPQAWTGGTYGEDGE